MLAQAYPYFQPMFWQAASFSAVAIGLVLFSIWWLFFSPVKKNIEKTIQLSPTIVYRLVALIMLSSTLRFLGTFWDVSEHVITGVVPGGEDFLWPPHISIYLSYLISLVVAGITILIASKPYRRAGIMDPRYWVRQLPYVGAMALAGVYAILSVPGDAIWHELYGLDLTAWSPPHVLLGIASVVETICAAGMLLQTQSDKKQARLKHGIVMALLAMAMNLIYIVGVIEWEVPANKQFATGPILARANFSYLLVSAVMSYAFIALARGLTRARWASTLTGVFFFTIRLGANLFLFLIGGVQMRIPLVFLLGAFLMDAIPWQNIPARWLRFVAMGTVYGSSIVLSTYPHLMLNPTIQLLNYLDYLAGFALSVLVITLMQPLLEYVSKWFNLRAFAAQAAGD